MTTWPYERMQKQIDLCSMSYETDTALLEFLIDKRLRAQNNLNKIIFLSHQRSELITIIAPLLEPSHKSHKVKDYS
jgi:hypothetical protein